MSIREDLLNKYAEDMVNYCTTASNDSLQDALTSSVNLLNEKEQQILKMENKIEALCSELFAYGEKHCHDTSIHKRHVEEKCKYRKYSTLFWFMLFLYVARVLIPTL